jgi:hypothetical protein
LLRLATMLIISSLKYVVYNISSVSFYKYFTNLDDSSRGFVSISEFLCSVLEKLPQDLDMDSKPNPLPLKKKTKLRCRSPQANYTDRATAACRRS